MHNIEDKNDINKDLFNYVMKILKELDIEENNVDIIRRIGNKEGRRPVVVTLISQRDKYKFFDNHDKLKKRYGIVITNDSTKAKRENYKKFKSIKEELATVGIEAKIRKSLLQVENQHYDLKQALEYLKKTKTNNESDSDQSIESNVTSASKKRERAVSITPKEAKNLKRSKRNNKGNKETKNVEEINPTLDNELKETI